MNAFYNYFSNLENDIYQTTEAESEHFSKTHEFNGYNAKLDYPLTHNEVINAVKINNKQSVWPGLYFKRILY